MVVIYTLTPATAAQQLLDNGFDALGLTAPILSPVWGAGAPSSVDTTQMTITFAQVPNAPFRGIVEFVASASAYRDVTGAPLAGPAGVLKLHPAAAARLERLAASRYQIGNNPQILPVPVALVAHGVTDNVSARSYDAAEALPGAAGSFQNAAMSFHDARGLIIDPSAVAVMLADLIGAFPALDVTGTMQGAGGAGGLTTIAGQAAAGRIVHVVSLHGRAFTPVPDGPSIARLDASNAVLGAPDAHGLVTLGTGEQVGGTGTDAATRIRVAFNGGVMAPGPIAPPAGITLTRQFIRVFAVDLDWHLRGNRSGSDVLGVPAADLRMPASLHPQVRDGVTVDYLPTGPDTMGAIAATLARMTGAPPGGLAFAVSPDLVDDFALPAGPGPGARWPAFPAPPAVVGMFPVPPAVPLPQPAAGATAQWSGTADVLVTIPAAAAPAGAAVRIYPRDFRIIEAIDEAPSFVRGDGGASIAVQGAATQVLVANPFGLLPGDPQPPNMRLVFDLVITPRAAPRRTFTAISLPVLAGPAPTILDPFAGPVSAIPLNARSIAPSALFGIPGAPVPPAAPPAGINGVIATVLALTSETQPRQGPRLPTMGWHETMVVTGIPAPAQVTAPQLAWDGVLSGVRWTREGLSASHNGANPGNPAGPDAHGPGVHVTGLLAYDMANHAVRRVQAIGPTGAGAPGWPVMRGGNNFNLPTAPGGAPTGTSSGIFLETVAAICDTPELALVPDDHILASQNPITLDDVLANLGNWVGLGDPPDLNLANGDRLAEAVRKEVHTAKNGIRDALWSLTRAFSEADELVYIETAGLARTARGTGQAHMIDLIQVLANRMAANPALKVVICCPRETDFAPSHAPWVRQAIAARTEAVTMLLAIDPARVAVFHPRGFPGRFAAIRTTSVIVDDVWCLCGATHLRRRGMTFDGSASIASLDRTLQDGYSLKVRAFRRALMAEKLGIAQVDAAGFPTGEWIRLERPAGAFDLVSDLLAQGGLGLLSPLWLGPRDMQPGETPLVAAQTDDVADPDGTDGASLATLLGALLGGG